MHLHRVTPDPFENYNWHPDGKFLGTSSEEYRASTLHFDGQQPLQVVVTRFARFGGGKHRQSDFDVYAEWSDVEKIIEKFCEANHPRALALQEAAKLLAALKALGWRESEDHDLPTRLTSVA